MRPESLAGNLVVVITGAAGGIGAALARRFAREGARLALLDRERAPLESLAAALAEQGTTARALPCDITDADQCEAAMREVESIFGGIDVLVNNAGITHVGRVDETRTEVLRRVMEVNFFGAVHCTKAALPSLVERRGRIVVLSSVAGFAPLATRAGYAASKHALHGFFDSLRSEYRDEGLEVMLVCPSFVDTAIGDRALAPDGGADFDLEDAAVCLADELGFRHRLRLGAVLGRQQAALGLEARAVVALPFAIGMLDPALDDLAVHDLDLDLAALVLVEGIQLDLISVDVRAVRRDITFFRQVARFVLVASLRMVRVLQPEGDPVAGAHVEPEGAVAAGHGQRTVPEGLDADPGEIRAGSIDGDDLALEHGALAGSRAAGAAAAGTKCCKTER